MQRNIPGGREQDSKKQKYIYIIKIKEKQRNKKLVSIENYY
jgi:hypothetical protein